MKMSLVRLPKNPLDLPEIRTLVASFLDRKDCLVCMRVSKGWCDDFAGAVWYTVDLAKDKGFIGLHPQVVGKYGRHVRQVSNIITFDQVKALLHPELNKIQSMDIVNHINPYHRALEFDILRRNIETLTSLQFRGPPPQSDVVEVQRTLNQNYLETSLLIPPFASSTSCGSFTTGSRLTSLHLRHVCLIREGFSALLWNSPVLGRLTLYSVPLLHHNPAVKLLTSSSVTYLNASLAAFWTPDSADLAVPSLLCHFPMLVEWHIRSVHRPPTWSHGKVRKEIVRCCPRLKSYGFEKAGRSDGISDLLFDCIQQPESLNFPFKHLNERMTLGLISHNNTLTSVTITGTYTNAAELKWVYLIPKSCSHLKVFSAKELVLDMMSVEEHEWSCQDLRELYVRFKGLEGDQPVYDCLRDVCFQRRRPSRFSTVNTITSQVSRHLLQFVKLSTVSLGKTVYTLSLP